MRLIDMKCTNCGATLNVYSTLGRAFCESCESTFLIEDDMGKKMDKKISGDNPVSIKYVREETSELKLASIIDGFISTIHEDTMRIYLAIISGVSKEICKGYDLEIHGGFVSSKPEILGHKLSKNEKNALEEEQKKAEKYIEIEKNIKNLFAKYDVSFDKQFDQHSNYKECINGNHYYTPWSAEYAEFTRDTYRIIGKKRIVPTYFDGHFSDIASIYERIKGKHEIDLMAAACVDYISKNSDKLNYRFFFEKYYQGFHITECGLSPSALDVKFNTFGMQKLPNCDTAVALCIALFSKIIMRTSKRGQYMLDFDGVITAVNRKGCEYVGHEMRESPYDDLFDICLKPLVRAVKIYKEW